MSDSASAPPASGPLRYHWLRLRAACHPTERLDLVRQAVEFAAGVPLELTITDLDSHHGGTVRLVEAEVAKARNIRNALQRILDLPGARDDLIATLDARTDEDGVFYVRVDKQEAAQGRLVLTRGEDAIQVRLKMEHYPATREAAVALLGQMLASPQL